MSMSFQEKYDVYVYQPSGPLRGFRILGADVKPQKLRDELLKPWVIVKEDGTVQTAHCTCMAGFGETCSHVAALLFKIELGVRIGLSTPGTTEELCRWNNNFSNSALSLPMCEIDLRKRKWDTMEKPRKINVLPRKKIAPLTGLDLAKIKQIQPDAVYFTSFVSDSSETDSASDNEEVLPLTLLELFKAFKILNRDGMKSHYNVQNCKNLEEATQGQGSLWLDHKVGRLTSSNFGVVIKRKKWSEDFSNSILFPRNLNVPAVKWGRSMEKTAIDCYVELSKQNHANFVYKPAGLSIAPNDPHLGASPDGKINCDCCGEGVLEIKCPFKHKECDPKLISIADKSFCLNGTNELKDTHNYYFQVQGQMAICNSSYCDFCIWTKKGILIHRVYKDVEFMDKHKTFLNNIYDKWCLPFLIKKFKQ